MQTLSLYTDTLKPTSSSMSLKEQEQDVHNFVLKKKKSLGMQRE